MEKCNVVFTDSGGLQEEAPALGKPVLVMREVTERQEGVDAGTWNLVEQTEKQLFVSWPICFPIQQHMKKWPKQ